MSSYSPARSNTPYSDYTSPRSPRGPTAVEDARIIEVYILKNTVDPVLVLVPVARVETYSVFPPPLSLSSSLCGWAKRNVPQAFWGVIKNDLYPGSAGTADEPEIPPMVFLLDPFMSRLRLELWTDLLPSLRGKRLLVLPGDAAPPPSPTESKPSLPQYVRSTWTNLMPKSNPIVPETSLVTVDAAQRVSSEPKRTWTKATSEASRPKLKPEDRSLSFFKAPEFAFDVALWCRFAPTYKPSLLMHSQFREIVVQAVPTPKGLSVRNLTSKVSSALTNMLRRQGCLGTLTSSPMTDFGDLLVKPEFLRFALEDWPSCKESLGLTSETLRWIQEPVLLYCEIQDVHFPRGLGGVERPTKPSRARKVEIESASEEEME